MEHFSLSDAESDGSDGGKSETSNGAIQLVVSLLVECVDTSTF